MRRSLALRSFLVSALTIVVFVVPLALLLRSVARERALTLAQADARAIAPVLSRVGDARVSGLVRSVAASAAPRRISIVFPDGSVLGTGEVIERDPLADPEALARARTGLSFATDAPGGAVLYEPVLRSNGSIAVTRVFVPDSLLAGSVAQQWLLLGAIGLALIAVAVFTADRLARSIVGSVSSLAETANRLGTGDVTARSEPDGPPELRVVGASLNRLADRIEELIETERAAAADLQHRLRTPATALRAEISSLSSEEDRRRLAHGLDELTRTIDEIIREAAQPVRRGIGVSADLAAITRTRVEFWRVLAEDQRRSFTADIACDRAEVAVIESDLGAVLDVLLDNVFSHTPEGTAFSVALECRDGEVAAWVRDCGPGLRGSTLPARGRSGSGSTGLGLDIVRKVVEGAGGWVEIGDAPEGGTVASFTLPLVGHA